MKTVAKYLSAFTLSLAGTEIASADSCLPFFPPADTHSAAFIEVTALIAGVGSYSGFLAGGATQSAGSFMHSSLITYSATGVVPFLPSGAIRPISIQVTRERAPRITIDESDVSPNGPTTLVGSCSKNGIIYAAGGSASFLVRVSFTSPNLK